MQGAAVAVHTLMALDTVDQAPRVLPPQGATIQEMDEAEHAQHGGYNSSQPWVQEPEDPAGASPQEP